MTALKDKRLKGIDELPLEFRHRLNETQIACVLRYVAAGDSGRKKLKAVYEWRTLFGIAFAKSNTTKVDVAKKIGKASSRISEYINFKHVPSNEDFNKIEMILFGLCR